MYTPVRLVVLPIILLIIFVIPAAQAREEMHVCLNGCDYSSIQAAIDTAEPDDIIVVESGTYSEDLIVNNKSITLRGLDTGHGRPILAGINGLVVIANGFVLRGFQITDERTLNLIGRDSIYLNNFPASGGILTEGSKHWNSSEPISYQFESKIFRGHMGNYWANYTGTDKNHDGIGDQPKVIDSQNTDYYPLMQPVENYGITGEKEDRMETIKAKLNEPFNITLESNPTTGYKWYADYDYDFLKLNDQRFERGPSDAIVAGGHEIFIFTPLRAGETRISMVYRRPWENIVADTRTFLIRITSG